MNRKRREELGLLVALMLIVLSLILAVKFSGKPKIHFELKDLTGHAMADGSRVARTFNASLVYPGQIIRVSLQVTINGLHTYYAYEEHLPAGWTPVDTSGNPCAGSSSTCDGGWTQGGSPQHWILKKVYINATVQAPSSTFYYNVKAPMTAGLYDFSGVYWIEGMTAESAIEGSTRVEVRAQQSCTPTNPNTEVCDGLDNDCNGLLDMADPNILRVNCQNQSGVCQGSKRVACNGAGGWALCNSTVYLAWNSSYQVTETLCDGKDNDCDGTADEGCQCTSGQSRACSNNTGECRAGNQSCINGLWQTCTGIIAAIEICDGKDNNCDGRIDETCGCVHGSTRPCGNSTGECRIGVEICNAGTWGMCNGTRAASEICDGKDNNCDSRVDETCGCVHGSTRPCGNSTGECRTGQETCNSGTWGACIGSVAAVPEICDGKDNNCNGQTDEGLIAPNCPLQAGVCQNSKKTCGGILGWLNCSASSSYGQYYQLIETLCDSRDNDCDNVVDENCTCVTGSNRTCGTDIGECVTGIQSCINGLWGSCQNSVSPVNETCDGKDNDCDGNIDDDLSAEPCSLNLGVCQGKSKLCGGTAGWLPCNATRYGIYYEQTETTCDGRDNDCDGISDEGCGNECTSGQTRRCGTDAGECSFGSQTCVNGVWSACQGGTVATAEVCGDGKDNDCDGVIDNGCQSSSGGTRGGGGGGSSSGGSSSGGNATPPRTVCTENWTCSEWGACGINGLKYRTCQDTSRCNTSSFKPVESQSCSYEGTCQDGLMNGGEEGIDCGARCNKPCSVIPENVEPAIEIIADDITANVLSPYLFKVKLVNHGTSEAESLRLTVNKWTDQTKTFDYLLKGQSIEYDFNLNLPNDPAENELTVQLFYRDALIAERRVQVSLSVPDYSMILSKDSDGKIYSVVVVDNTHHIDRKVSVEYSINRGSETVFAEADRAYEVTAGTVWHKIENLSLNLPDGDYQVKSMFYADGVKVGESQTSLIINSGKEHKSRALLFYTALGIISLTVLILYYRVWRGDS